MLKIGSRGGIYNGGIYNLEKIMHKSIFTTPTGERFVILPEAEFEKTMELAEDAADIAAAEAAEGTESIPAEIVNRLIDEPENRLRIWREYRGLSASALAKAVGISNAYLSEIENGKQDGSISVMKKIAAALRVDLDDIA